MDSIVEGLMKQMMSGDNLSVMSNNIGADEKSTKSALEMGLPLLLGALSAKASKPEGANAIISSLAQVGSNNPLDSMASYIGGSGSSQGTDMLNSILGSSLQPIQQAISKKTGLPTGVVGQLLSMALPLVLGSLTKSSSGQSMGTNDLSKLLGEQSKMAMSASPDAAGVMKELLASQEGGSGIMGLIKKMFKS
ncbi:MAG TPA: DUF937 domain-containing protein [Methanothrix sp.]|jgi:hypothetical protein|nr:DUF937 domain-containing protein [Methanothrix sp.]HPC90022.1 DUF937 domain-containing protein [Methanothrix sp.]HQE88013.1 DUF937 domain-containing protein [Methanothrix sp.]HQI68489.1 DUF937 domain-containing protein [Methanothrix sp.]HRS84598.1 DUF937 domain-containing protein [Methanothrix sp.]